MSKMTIDPWFLNQLQRIIGWNGVVWIDEFIGLRGWGLILYGVLPSNLAFLGILDTKLPDVDKFSIIFILGASIIPIFFIFVLISDQNKKWYLTKDRFGIRSLTITFLIIFLSTLIFEISGIIHKKYFLCLPWNLETFTASAECFFSAISSLVISSSLFVIALTRKTDFPMLPSVSFVKSMGRIERNIRKIKSEDIWEKYTTIDDSLIKLVEDTEKEVYNIIISKGNNLAKRSLERNFIDLKNLEIVLKKIGENRGEGSKKIDWKIYFGNTNLNDDQHRRRYNEENVFNSLERLRNLELED
jgi:hypothetical protein